MYTSCWSLEVRTGAQGRVHAEGNRGGCRTSARLLGTLRRLLLLGRENRFLLRFLLPFEFFGHGTSSLLRCWRGCHLLFPCAMPKARPSSGGKSGCHVWR